MTRVRFKKNKMENPYNGLSAIMVKGKLDTGSPSLKMPEGHVDLAASPTVKIVSNP